METLDEFVFLSSLRKSFFVWWGAITESTLDSIINKFECDTIL